MNKWQGKLKAVTFSFDDGVKQDQKLINIFNKYGLKGTFNLNSACLGCLNSFEINGKIVRHDKVRPSDVKSVYKGHEVAVHTLSHQTLPELDDDTVVYQVEKDRLNLSELVEYNVVGMAYPNGGLQNDDRVADVIKRRTGVKYSRTISSTGSFDLQENLYRFNPSVYYLDEKSLFELGYKFIKMEIDKPQLYYIWGHSYDMDAGHISWERFEEFCKLISNKSDIFYGTNKEVFL